MRSRDAGAVRGKIAPAHQGTTGCWRALGAKPLSFKQVLKEYRAAGKYLKPFVANTVVLPA